MGDLFFKFQNFIKEIIEINLNDQALNHLYLYYRIQKVLKNHQFKMKFSYLNCFHLSNLFYLIIKIDQIKFFLKI